MYLQVPKFWSRMATLLKSIPSNSCRWPFSWVHEFQQQPKSTQQALRTSIVNYLNWVIRNCKWKIQLLFLVRCQLTPSIFTELTRISSYSFPFPISSQKYRSFFFSPWVVEENYVKDRWRNAGGEEINVPVGCHFHLPGRHNVFLKCTIKYL